MDREQYRKLAPAPLLGESPIDYVDRVHSDPNWQASVWFAKELFGIESHELKCLWLSSPLVQEAISRKRIYGSRDRGGDEYGSSNWIRRRFDLSWVEAKELCHSFWSAPADRISQLFLDEMPPSRIARSQLTERSMSDFARLCRQYNRDPDLVVHSVGNERNG